MSADSAADSLTSSFARLRQASRSDTAVSAGLRQDRLRRLLALLAAHTDSFAEAISADFGHRSVHETRLAEVLVVEAGIKHALRHVEGWMRPRRVRTTLPFWPGVNRLMPQPLGIVGIISPWNYPLQLTLAPMVGALAAGNRVMIKPSELVPRFAALLGRAVAEHFGSAEAVVAEGGADVSQAFAALPFDHLLFTGSPRVGRLVAAAAAKNLTPVTLELGGKSPAIIDRSADLAESARRIAFGKLMNAGQTCIAPDYVLCPRGDAEAFVAHYFSAVERLYGSDPSNPDYTAIIDQAHYDRLDGLLTDAANKGARIERRAGENAEWKCLGKFPPCLVLATTDEMLVSREEIFGPILPVIACEDAEHAIAYINARDRPLALYWFGTNGGARDQILGQTVAGGVTINDCLLHVAQEHQPFGGVGISGSGAYHGEWGFRTFSTMKPVFYRPRLSGTALLQPPYGETFARMLALVRRLI